MRERMHTKDPARIYNAIPFFVGFFLRKSRPVENNNAKLTHTEKKKKAHRVERIEWNVEGTLAERDGTQGAQKETHRVERWQHVEGT